MYADTVGVIRDGRSMLSMALACGRSKSQSVNGNSLLAPHKKATKLSFEYLNGFLGLVTVVVMGRDKLVGHVVTFDGVLELIRAFVVQDVVLGDDVGCVQAVN